MYIYFLVGQLCFYLPLYRALIQKWRQSSLLFGGSRNELKIVDYLYFTFIQSYSKTNRNKKIKDTFK